MVMMKAKVSNIADRKKSNLPFFNGKDKPGFFNFDTVLDWEKDKWNDIAKTSSQNDKDVNAQSSTVKEKENIVDHDFNEKEINDNQKQENSLSADTQNSGNNESTIKAEKNVATEESDHKEVKEKNKSNDFENSFSSDTQNSENHESTIQAEENEPKKELDHKEDKQQIEPNDSLAEMTGDNKVQETVKSNPETEQSPETNLFEPKQDKNSTLKEEKDGTEAIKSEDVHDTKQIVSNENDTSKAETKTETAQSDEQKNNIGEPNENEISQAKNDDKSFNTEKVPERNEEDQNSQKVLSDGSDVENMKDGELQANETNTENQASDKESNVQATEETIHGEKQAEISGVNAEEIPVLHNDNEWFKNSSELPESNFKHVSLGAYDAISADSASKQKEVNNESQAKEEEVNQYSENIKIKMSSAFANQLSKIGLFLNAQKNSFNLTVITAIANFLRIAGITVNTGVTAVSRAGLNLFARINGLLSVIQQGVFRISSFVGNLIHSIPVPNIPGAGRIRNFVGGMINKAIYSIQAVSSKYKAILANSLSSGMTIIYSRLNLFLLKVNGLISAIMNAVNSFMVKSNILINQLILRVKSKLLILFSRKASKFVSMLKRRILLTIRRLRRKTLEGIKRNTKKHLARLYALVWIEKNKRSLLDNESSTEDSSSRLVPVVNLIRESAKGINSANLILFRFKLNIVKNTLNSASLLISENLLKTVWKEWVSLIPKVAVFIVDRILGLYNSFKLITAIVRSRLVWLMSAVFTGFKTTISFIHLKVSQFFDLVKNIALRSKDLIIRRVREMVMGT
jgi:hypothetical protein